MSALDRVVEWASTLPDWQADAVRRILLQTELSNDDADQISLMLKAYYGLIDPDQAPTPVRLKKDQICFDSSCAPSVVIEEMKCISGINALPDGATIGFAPSGISIIYGDNGAGKSGYVRVLKRACTARDTSETIIGNVFQDDITSAAKAQFTLSVDGEQKPPIDWVDGQGSTYELSQICVFDAGCGRVIVDEKNEVRYIPEGAHVFESLASLVRRVRNQIEQEKPRPKRPVVEMLDPQTKAGQFLETIDHKTAVTNIKLNAEWTKSDETRLEKLVKEIARLEINDPNKDLDSFKRQQEKIRTFAKYLLAVASGLSEQIRREVSGSIQRLVESEKAVEIASRLTLAGEPVDGAGTSAWRLLYDAAKTFAIEHAYPGEDFPFVGEKARCVLCMQPLDEEAKERFLKFRTFMEDTTRSRLENAKRILETARNKIRDLTFGDDELGRERLHYFAENHPQIYDEIVSYLASLRKRQETFLSAISSKTLLELPASQKCPRNGLSRIYHDITKRINDLGQNGTSEKLIGLKAEKSELEAKKLLSTHFTNLCEYVRQLDRAILYEKCLSELNTQNISLQGKKIISSILTPQLEKALDEEIKALGASHLPLCFKVSGQYGATEHQLILDGACLSRGCTLSRVLSEGEQTVIGISGFLAELQISDQKNPVIFDDPVCSLDHKFRAAIARRLAQEGKIRQIIIFTHDLPFVMMLYENCEKFGCDLETMSIERTPATPGLYRRRAPWDALNVSKRISFLKGELQQLKKSYPSCTTRDYEAQAGSFYGLLRETWERLVEELLLNGVVHRFGRDIQTNRIKRLTDITDDDCRIVDEAMTKCSRIFEGHDKAPDLNEPAPIPDEISDDLELLDKYRLELSNKRKRAPRS